MNEYNEEIELVKDQVYYLSKDYTDWGILFKKYTQFIFVERHYALVKFVVQYDFYDDKKKCMIISLAASTTDPKYYGHFLESKTERRKRLIAGIIDEENV